jgi:hypothetical protein
MFPQFHKLHNVKILELFKNDKVKSTIKEVDQAYFKNNVLVMKKSSIKESWFQSEICHCELRIWHTIVNYSKTFTL